MNRQRPTPVPVEALAYNPFQPYSYQALPYTQPSPLLKAFPAVFSPYGYDNFLLHHPFSFLFDQTHKKDKTHVRTKRYLGGHRHPNLLTAPIHFFLRVIPRLLTFPLVQAMRLFTGSPHLLPHVPRYPHGGPRFGHYKNHHHHPSMLRSPAMHSRFGPMNNPRGSARLKAPPSKAFLLERLQQINRLSDVSTLRRKRAIFETNEISLPFFKVSEEDYDYESSEETNDNDSSNNVYDKDKVAREYLQPFSVQHMVPHNPFFYFLNAPIRVLNHINNFKNHLKPIFTSVPLIMQNSKNYIRDLFRQFHSYILDFFSNVIGNFDEIHTSRGNLDVLLPDARYRRSITQQKNSTESHETYQSKNGTEDINRKRSTLNNDNGRSRRNCDVLMSITRHKRNMEQEQSNKTDSHESFYHSNKTQNSNRKKRYILKVVDDKEVHDFLREKLGNVKEETTTKNATNEHKRKPRKKYVIQPLTPKIIVDNNGKTFVEIDGMKRPLLSPRRHKMHADLVQQTQSESIQEDLNQKISNLIEQARIMAAQKVDVPSAAYDASMYLQIIKEKITQTLNNIEQLINTDFGKYIDIYEELLKLQNLKNLITDEWKQLLIANRCNDMEGKIRILNVFQQIQVNREKILQMIAATMREEQNFMTPKLIKALVRLQKLQCIVVKIVEDFANTLHLRTLFDAQKEVKYVEYLQTIYLLPEKTLQDVESTLKNERDIELEKEIQLLESLRHLIERNDSADVINEHAKILWEIKNIEKLQKESIIELDNKITQGQKIRKELKILFDLQRQLENTQNKQKELLDRNKAPVVKQDESLYIEDEYVRRSRDNVKRQTKHKDKDNSKNSKFKIWPLMQSRLSPRIGKDRKPVKIITNGYTLTGYLSHNNLK